MTSTFDHEPHDGMDPVVGEGDVLGPDVAGLVDGAILVARMQEVREFLAALPGVLERVPGDDLVAMAAAAAGVVAAAKATQAGIVWEADERGVIADSDHPRVAGWVEASCREGGAPVSPGMGRVLEQLIRDCRGQQDVAPLKAAVLGGSLPVERGAEVATTYRRLRARIEVDCWEVVLAELIGFVASGARRADVAALEETLVGQYGRAGELEDERARLYERRELSGFRRTRAGMLQATLLLDPASEAVFSAAVHALSAPRPDPETGVVDPRGAGARRADALVAMARHATNADPGVPGSGAGARVVVTMTLADLQARLQAGLHEGTPVAAAEAPEAGSDAPNGTGPRPRRVGRSVFGQVLTPGEVRLLACDAQVIPAVLGGAGELLDLGRSRRLATPGILTALALRDQGCSYPGCTMPPGWCDAHHLRHWVDGGATSVENMSLLCRQHHTTVHRHRHVGELIEGQVVWRRRDGTPIGNRPRAA